MNFSQFSKLFQEHVKGLVDGQSHLYVVDVDKDVLWNTYLDSFPSGTNEIYRTRREYDCGCCRNFIKTFGAVVAIGDDYRVLTAWGFDPQDATFSPVVRAMDDYVRGMAVRDVHVTKTPKFGTDKSLEQLENGTVHVWNHFACSIPHNLVTRSPETEATIAAEFRSAKEVFSASLRTIEIGAVDTVLDLIEEKILYRGEEWHGVLLQFRALLEEYNDLSENERDNFCWKKSVGVGGSISRIKNHSIGTLLLDLSNREDVEVAIRKYEAIMAPTNYKRPKEIITKKMVDAAQKTVEEMGLGESLGRRFAEIADISINNVLWADRDAAKHMDGVGGVFDQLRDEATVKPKDVSRAQPISIEDFLANVMPTATRMSVLFEGGLSSNLVSLIAPKNVGSRSLFKWNNGFSWVYNGNVADSIKERVKAAGGKVDGVLRFSIQWNAGPDFNANDYDAHCIEPNKNHIYYAQKKHHASKGELDVDIIRPVNGHPAVENITWPELRYMQEGEYQFYVKCYSARGGQSGFTAELEYGGNTYEYAFDEPLWQGQVVNVVKLEFSKSNGIRIIQSLPATTSSREVWGISTNRFCPVTTIMYSPNYWDGQSGIGNKHYMFMLAGCVNPDQPNGFLNEYLEQGLLKHKRVFAALGSKMKVAASDEQLSGLGFSSTQRNTLVVRVDNKLFKVVF